MAAKTFPLAAADIADRLRIDKVSWTLVENQEISTVGTGEILAAELGPSLWRADITTARLTHREAHEIRAMINLLDGSINTFYLYDPLGKYPYGDPTGSIVGSNNVQLKAVNANRKEIQFKGLPAGYVLNIGDMVAHDYGSNPTRRNLYQIAGTVTADVSGETGYVEVRPHVRTGSSSSDALYLKKPAAKMKMIPGSLEISNDTLTSHVIRFQATQTL